MNIVQQQHPLQQQGKATHYNNNQQQQGFCQNFGSFGNSAPFSTYSSYQPFSNRDPLGDRTNTIHTTTIPFNSSAFSKKSNNDFSFFSIPQPHQQQKISNPFSAVSRDQQIVPHSSSHNKVRIASSKKSQKRSVLRKSAPTFPAITNESLMDEDVFSDDDDAAMPCQHHAANQSTDSEIDNHFNCQYTKEIFEHMRNTEMNHRPNSRYIDQTQSDINSTMRGILVDWLVEVCGEFELLPETLYLAVNITDRALGCIRIDRCKLQMIGVTALFISSKYYEMQPPSIDDFVYITDNTYQKEEILAAESQILNALGFDLTVVTIIDFLDRYLKAAGANDLVSDLAHFLAELTLQEYSMIGYLPSAVAASCVVLALFCLNVPHWTSNLKRFTGYVGPELQNCIADMLKLYQQVDQSTLTAVKDKYSTEAKNRIAMCKCSAKEFDFDTLQ